MDIEDIKKLVEDGKRFKHNITMKDISYVLLWQQYNNPILAYKSIFEDNTDKNIKKYDSSKLIDFVKGYIIANFGTEATSRLEEDVDVDFLDYSKDITFEENKEAMLRKIAVIERKMIDGKIPDKDGEKMIVDIRTKLNDKFAVAEKIEQQYIIVERKYNHICPHLHKECYVYTKEDLMEEYGLVDKKELEKKYDLVLKNK